MRTPELVFAHEYVAPKPMMLTIGDVTFPVSPAFSALYNLFKGAGMLDEFMEEAKPHYWKSYQEALRLKQIKEDRKREIRQSAAENLRIKQNAKRQERRQNKNGITTPDNAVSKLIV